MNLLLRIADPVTRKRLRRFRRKRRSSYSLGALAALLLLGLGAELLCNDRPLYLRFEGRSFFPAFRYYPEDTFLANGKQTRPDYKRLAAHPVFASQPANFMVFPPVPFGPLESADPESLRGREVVVLTLDPTPAVGTVDLRPDYTVARGQNAGAFFGVADDAVAGFSLTNRWHVSPALALALARRFGNEAADRHADSLAARDSSTRAIEAVLSPFTARADPPRTVRLTLRETTAAAPVAARVTFDRRLALRGDPPPAWSRLDEATRRDILADVERAFSEPVPPRRVWMAGAAHAAAYRHHAVAFPHPPVRGHWLGLDAAGRDVLARILYALRTSLSFGLLLVLSSMVIGSLIGAVQGYFGGATDIAGQRLIEIWSALPFLYVMILMGSVFGQGFLLLLICYGLFNWIGISYYMRGEFLRLRRQPFVDAARCIGIPARKIILRHIMPNALTPVITFFPFSLVGAIGSLAALDYLGFGLPPPTPSWGELLQQAQMFRWAWWLILYPSLALFTVMVLGVFVGEGVRDAFDPRPFSRME
jgi:microcin C transport system permease protein